MEMMTMLAILLIVSATALGLATSLVHLRRRHREARYTIGRLARERDKALADLANARRVSAVQEGNRRVEFAG